MKEFYIINSNNKLEFGKINASKIFFDICHHKLKN